MSFRNINSVPNQKIKIEEGEGSAHLISSSKYCFNEEDSREQILKKISSIIVSLHEGYLAKCKNIQIYRDLSEEEQNLLLTVEKNTAIHTALAGILAIDSCVKCINKEETFIIANIVRTTSLIIGFFKSLEKTLPPHTGCTDYCTKLGDSLRHLVQQIYCLPAARGREEDQQRQLSLLDKQQIQRHEQQQYEQQYKLVLGELQRENQMLKIGIKQKEGYISMLECRYDRGLPRFEKHEDKNTSHTIGFKMSTEKSSQNGSNSASAQHLYEQISHLKEELLEKNNIVIKMNEQFASEMEKYNSVFKRLEGQNRLLKRYSDLDTACLLEELQYQIEMLREEKRKDQMIIGQIQRKIEGISMTRTSRINTRHGYQFTNRQYPQYSHNQHPHFEHRPPFQNRYTKFYSPTYATRLSPYSRPLNTKQDLGFGGYQPQPQQTYRSNVGSNLNRKIRGGQAYMRKSRNKLNQSKQSKQVLDVKPALNINLYQRVMSKRI